MNYTTILNVFTLFLWTSLAIQCASTTNKIKVFSQYRHQLAFADSLFKASNYETAQREYAKIRDNCDDPSIAALAQYRLATNNIYYDNAQADYETALEEFKRFDENYPQHEKTEMVKNWIRILTAFQSYSRDYEGNSETLSTIKQWCSKYIKQYSIIKNSFQKCETERDSLKQQIIVLEGIIEKITNTQKQRKEPSSTK